MQTVQQWISQNQMKLNAVQSQLELVVDYHLNYDAHASQVCRKCMHGIVNRSRSCTALDSSQT